MSITKRYLEQQKEFEESQEQYEEEMHEHNKKSVLDKMFDYSDVLSTEEEHELKFKYKKI